MQNDEDGHSHDVHIGSTEGTNSSHWAFNSVFGIVHAKNCSVCRSYIMHLANANHSGDTSFKAALHDRESRISEAFMDGVQTGQQLQQEDDVSVLLRYREQRDSALKSFEEQKKQLDAAREEIQRLESRAQPPTALDDDTVVERNNETKSISQSNASSSARSALLTPTVDLDDIDSDVDVLSPLSSTNHALPMVPDVPTATKGIGLDQAASLKAGKAQIDSPASSLSSPAPESVDSLPGTHSYAAIASQESKTSPPATPKSVTTPLTLSTQTLPNPTIPTPATTHAAHNVSRLTSISQAKALMSAAHAGDDSALETIKSFCSVMHQIPTNQRSALHHYVAEHWRKPSRVSPAPAPGFVVSGIHSSAENASQPPATPKPATTPLTPSKLSLPNSVIPSSSTTPTAHNASHPTSIAQLQALMSAAHAGNVSALETIRSFCSVMHQIPTNQRTELHHYVAQHWRSPSRVSSTSKQRSFSTEIYVDATTWGIGFIMNGVWTAWKFPSWPPVRGNGIDMGWAKMLAVEAGLRTVVHWVNLMIHTEGANFPLVITVQTDHWGIKREIEKGQSNKPRRQEVLQRILGMLSEFNIQLTLKGIDPTENLASNPARGAPGLGATQLSFIPSIPSHLTAILNPIPMNN